MPGPTLGTDWRVQSLAEGLRRPASGVSTS